MVKFLELKNDQLKKELSARNLPTSGTKAELQQRLREAMEQDNLNADDYDFQIEGTKDEGTKESGSLDLMSILAAIKNSTDEVNQSINAKTDELNQSINAKTDELNQSINAKTDDLREQMLAIKEGIHSRVQEIDSSVQTLKCDFNNLRQQVIEIQNRPVPLRPVNESANSKFKAPSFDGTSSFTVFKLQFETTASANSWTREEMAAALVVSLKGSAAEALQMIPPSELNNYETIITALQRRYGSEHKKQIYQMEVANRKQHVEENLKEFSAEIERLAHLAFAEEMPEFREKQMIQAFITGIRDPEIKKAAYSFPKPTFGETVAFALTQETACLLSKPFGRVRQIQAEENNATEALLRKIESLVEHKGKKFAGRCYNCGKIGHIARNCRKQASERANFKQPEEQLN